VIDAVNEAFVGDGLNVDYQLIEAIKEVFKDD